MDFLRGIFFAVSLEVGGLVCVLIVYELIEHTVGW